MATAAGARLDDALRQYLAEQGTKQVPLESVAVLAGGATRVRLAGVAINQLHEQAPHGVVVPADDAELAEPATLLQRRADDVSEWYAELADVVADARRNRRRSTASPTAPRSSTSCCRRCTAAAIPSAPAARSSCCGPGSISATSTRLRADLCTGGAGRNGARHEPGGGSEGGIAH